MSFKLTLDRLARTTASSSRSILQTHTRSFRSRSWHPRSLPARTRLYGTATVLSLSAAGVVWNLSEVSDETLKVEKVPSGSALRQASIFSLARSYLVWTLLGFPVLVDSSPDMLDALLHSRIPGVPLVTEALVRATFFPQFIPGETAAECVPAMEDMRRRNVGSALNYCAEADCAEGDQLTLMDIESSRFQEVERALDVQGAFEQRMHEEGWARGSSAFALKVTGLIDPAVLIRASNTLHRIRAQTWSRIGDDVPFPGFAAETDSQVLIPHSAALAPFNDLPRIIPSMGMTEAESGLVPGDLEKLKVLWDRLDSLADRARRNGVRLILDAEESYYEPALDGYTLLLSMKYNRPLPIGADPQVISTPWNGPVIYGSYQSYLCRQPRFLQAAIKHAEENGYALGLKVVRGGYIVKEQRAWKAASKPGTGPVWPDKPKTDASYNGSVDTILSTMGRQLKGENPELALSVIFGTHNIDSVKKIIGKLQEEGLATVGASGKLKLRDNVLGKVAIAQLYGMRDDLSDLVSTSFEASKDPMSIVFVAYGRLRETMPFLSRRSIENKSVLSGAGGAAAERRRVGLEMRRRLTFGLFSY